MEERYGAIPLLVALSLKDVRKVDLLRQLARRELPCQYPGAGARRRVVVAPALQPSPEQTLPPRWRPQVSRALCWWLDRLARRGGPFLRQNLVAQADALIADVDPPLAQQ